MRGSQFCRRSQICKQYRRKDHRYLVRNLHGFRGQGSWKIELDSDGEEEEEELEQVKKDSRARKNPEDNF